MKRPSVVAKNIRRVRLTRGMTQEKLALESGLSQGYINQLENGRRRYTEKTLELVAAALSIPLIELFKENDEQPFPSKGVEERRGRRPSKEEFLALFKRLPDHVVEHYLTLLKLESKIWRRKR